MKTYVVFLRGINVGRRNVLPMKELVALFEDVGCWNIKTYIQSGNVVFQTTKMAASRLSSKISLKSKNAEASNPMSCCCG